MIKMSESWCCTYCGCKVSKYQTVCSECYKKLILIRKLKAIVFQIKRRAEEEKRDSG